MTRFLFCRRKFFFALLVVLLLCAALHELVADRAEIELEAVSLSQTPPPLVPLADAIAAAQLRPFMTANNTVVRCRVLVGLPKSGTTWIMNLLMTYLLLATGADPNHRTVRFAHGHVKRAEFSCQYEWGEKRRGPTYFDNDTRVELAYRLLPAFSHVVLNQESRGAADGPIDHDVLAFRRFFGVMPDKFRRTSHRHEPSVGHSLANWRNPPRQHLDTRCLLQVQLREPLAQALSACFYYGHICGDKSGAVNASAVRDLPSASKHSIMVPLNSTARWNRALAAVLRDATFARATEEQMSEKSTCPQLPYESNVVLKHPRELFFRRVRFLTYEQLRRDTAGELRRALELFELAVDEALIETTLRIIAARPQEELKQGLTTMSIDMFTPAQHRYVDDLFRRVDPLYTDVLDATNSGNPLLVRERSHVPFTSSLTELTATPERLAALRGTFERCWQNDANWSAVFRDELCHRAWEVRLLEGAVSEIVAVQALSSAIGAESERSNGALTLRMADERLAMFKVADRVVDIDDRVQLDNSFETWKAELVSHAIDRVLALRRVPATVPRRVRVNTVPRRSNDTAALWIIQKAAQNHRRVFEGALIGFTKFPVAHVRNFNRRFVDAGALFDVSRMPQPSIEFVRLALALFVLDEPHSFNHNTFTLASGRRDGTWEFLIGIDNDRAHWQRFSGSHLRLSTGELPACNRTDAEPRFSCLNFGRRHDKVEMRHLVSLFETACVFPRDVAERLEQVAAAAMPPSAIVHDYLIDQLLVARRLLHEPLPATELTSDWPEAAPLSMARWNATVFDLRVRFLASTVDKCVARFGRDKVLFDDSQQDFPIAFD